MPVSPPQRPGFDRSSDHVGFVVENWHWGRFSPSSLDSRTFLIPFTPLLSPIITTTTIIIIIQGWYSSPIVASVTVSSQHNEIKKGVPRQS
jgi:hypothetical protein